VRWGSTAPTVLDLPREAVMIDHLGYLGPDRVRAKAQRNLHLAQSELDELVASGSRDRAAAGRVLFDLARSCLAVGEQQRAVDALETMLEILPDGRARAAGAALLAQVLLDEGGYDDVALGLIDDLAGNALVDRRYVDWLRAQALDHQGLRAPALDLLRGIDAMVDPVGAPQPMGRVLRARAILAAQLGLLDEARTALRRAVDVDPSLAQGATALTALLEGRGVQLPGSVRIVPEEGPGLGLTTASQGDPVLG
jgi:tetratricopeptide (TPR) repeat protein